MKRRSTAFLLALGLTCTAVFSSACGGSKSAGTAAEPAAEEASAGEAVEVAQGEETAKNDEGDTALAPIEPAAAEESTEPQAETPAPASGKFHCELTEAGGFDANGSYRVTYDSLVRIDGDKVTFCYYDGKDADTRTLLNMDYMGWGLYSVTLEGDNVNTTGLVSADGKVLIPFEAAIIEWPRSHPLNKQPRYVLVMTGTETTEDQSEALFFVTDRQFAIMANEDDTYFKGTLKVFDLAEGRYVPGLEFSRGTDTSFNQVGENIMTNLTDTDTVFAPDGSVVYTAQSSLYCTADYILDRVDNQAVILDADGKEISRSDAILNTLDYNSSCFMKYEDSKYTVINSKGETVLGTPWSFIYGESLMRFRVKNDGDTGYSLVAADNTVIAQSDSLYEADSLGFFTFGSSGDYTLITPDNRIYEGLSGDTDNLFFVKDDSSYLVLNTGESAALPGSDSDDVLRGTFRVRNDSGKYALYDTFTGRELLGFEYDDIDDVNSDYIYAVKDGKAVIYKLTIAAE